MKWKSRRYFLPSLVLCLCTIAGTAAQQAQIADSRQPADEIASKDSGATSTADIANRSNSSEGNDYRLGIGDVIHIFVWHEQELTQTTVVRPDGKISLPLAGEFTVAGKSTVQIQDVIRDRLLRFVVKPQVTVSVVEIHSRQVYITGQVQRPGAYPLSGKLSVLQLIASAGGLTPYAHRKNIRVLDASNQPVAKFNYADAVRGKDKREYPLQPGYTVVVP